MKKLFLFCCVLSLICPPAVMGQENLEECTIGVASGKATADGRPLLWRNRDGSGRDYEVVYFKDGRFKLLATAYPGYSQAVIGAGVNEFGLCIVESGAFDLKNKSGKVPGIKHILRLALQQCVTVDDFESLLKQTNVSGRNTYQNVGLIDAFGGAAIFETGSSFYTRFDATNPKVAPQGYVIRANFALTGGGDSGRARYDRANQLWQQAIEKDRLDYRYVLRNVCRDLSGAEEISYTQPEMEITENNALKVLNNQNAISRPGTTNVALFHGVRPDENPSLTTFWAIIGGPIFSVAVPSWVIAESTAPELDGEEFSPICTAANDLYFANYVMGDKRTLLLNPKMLPDIWAVIYPAEDRIFDQTESTLTQWRQDYPTARQVASFHRHMASEAMDTLQEVTELLIQKGGATAHLRIALYMRDLEKAKAFIKQGFNINVLDGHGYAPLHYAVQNNQKEIIELLISKNADVNAKNRSGQTPLDIAVMSNRKDIAELLVANGAELSSIHVAARMGDLASVEAFLKGGTDVNVKDKDGLTPLHLAAKSRKAGKDIIELLIAKGADVNAKNNSGQTPTDLAVTQNRKEIVDLLIEKGAELSINVAAFLGDIDKIKSFIETGTDVNGEPGRGGRTPLYWAVRNKHKDVAKLLIHRAADVSSINLLYYACWYGYRDFVELFIQKGADVNSKYWGDAPSHYAIWGGYADVLELLLAHGADANAKDTGGWSLLHYAAGSGSTDMTRLLLNKGADVNAKEKEGGQTPLHRAAEKGHTTVAELLIANGADVNAKDNQGRTALDIAVDQGHTEIAELLRNHRTKE